MKRVNNSDINFLLNPKTVNLSNFNVRFYTVNSEHFFVRKSQDDVKTVEVETEDAETTVNYYLKLDWSELVTLGEGVLQYQLLNNYQDSDRADNYYNQNIERTTQYYIDSNVTVDEDEAESYAEIIAELGDKIDSEITRSTSADTLQTEALNSEIQIRQDQINEILDIIDGISGETDLSNYYKKSETSGATEISNALSSKVNSQTFINHTADTNVHVTSADKEKWDAKVDKSWIEDKLGSGFTGDNSANTVTSVIDKNEEVVTAALTDLNTRKLDASAYTPTDLTNYYTKSEVYNKSEIDSKGYITDVSNKLNISDFNTYSANTDNLLSRYHESIVIADQTATNAKTTADEAKYIANNTFNSLTQSDWNESDASKLSYIENKPFGETSGYVNIFANTGFSLTQCGQYNYGEMNGGLSLSEDLVDGEVYKVTVNGNDFIYTASTYNNILCLNFSGNPNVDTVTVFKSTLGGSYNISIYETYLNGDTSHAAISISKNGYQLVQIDNKYINYSGDTYIQSLVTRIDGKQDELVSGTNIKTINNQSLLGSGNITIEGGSGGGGFITVTNPSADTKVGLVNSLSQYYDTNIGKSAVIEGDGNTDNPIIASGDYSHSEGFSTTASGDYSHAEGQGTQASGDYSHSEGFSTTANGNYSHAEGSNTSATSYASHAEGNNTKASGYHSHAEGQSTSAISLDSHAEGYRTQASGKYSHAEGYYTSASTDYSHAEGSNTTANGSYSHAEGYSTKANGNFSHSEGYATETIGQYSHAEGNYTIANNEAEHASGKFNVSSSASTTFGDSGNTLFSVGNGTNYNARHNAFEIRQNGDIYITSGSTDIKLQDHLGSDGGSCGFITLTNPSADTKVGLVNSLSQYYDTNIGKGAVIEGDGYEYSGTIYNIDASGDYSHAEGYSTKASGNYSHAEGQSTVASGNYSHAEGSNTSAYTDYSHAEGYGATASGDRSHAEGSYTNAIGNYSHAEGSSSRAIGNYSHAEGSTTNAIGDYSHAEGGYTTASGSSSHAEGYYTTASGDRSHAEGSYTNASGFYSHAEGYNTQASGNYSHAEGYYTTVSGISSHAEGNETTASGDYSHAEGSLTVANNEVEHASGKFNISNIASTTFGDSGNTLFSVGNGTSQTRHNAFEIRQNGDIYITSGGTNTSPMVKLQDNLGGNVDLSNYYTKTEVDEIVDDVVAGQIDLTTYAKIDWVQTNYALKTDVPKIWIGTQSEYDNITNKNENTVYIIK